MDIRFYMFGVPDGFDIYQETSNFEIANYYQCFYDETIKENTRLAIHRKANDEVSYTYLKYHLSSAGDRKGSFIGLSVVFSGGYYADVSSLYNLLEYAYKGMLERGLILRPTANGNSAIYQTKKFEYEAAEVKRVEALVLNTLNSKEYASEFAGWDGSFDSGKPNTQLRIPFQIYNDNPENEQALNQLIVQRMRVYSWLSLSPDYIIKPTPTTSPIVKDFELDEILDPETKSRCKDDFEVYQKDVLSAFSEYVSKANDNLNEKVNSLSTDIRNILLLLNKYVKKECELDILFEKYKGLSKQLDDLITELNSKNYNSSKSNNTKTQSSTNNNVENNAKEEELSNGTSEDASKQKGGKLKSVLITSGVLLLAACIYACFLRPIMFPGEPDDNNTDSTGVQIADTGTEMEDGTEIKEKPNLDELVAQFNTSIQESKFADASRLYNQVVEVDEDKTRELDQALEDKFNALIADCKFDLANKMLKDCLCEVYQTVTWNERELKGAFRSHIRANRSDIRQKSELIRQIESAKQNGYGYDGIDEDLKFISALTAAPQQKKYSLLVYKDAGNTPQTYSSNDTIMLDVNVLYRIRVSDFVDGAMLLINTEQHDRYQAWHGNSNDLFYNKYKDHMVLLKSEKDEGYTEFDYKKDNNVLCKIKVKFVNPSSLSSRGFRRL